MLSPDSARWLELGSLWVNVSDEHEKEYIVYVERAGLTENNLALPRLLIADWEGEGEHRTFRQEPTEGSNR